MNNKTTPAPPTGKVIQDCTFTGIHFDAKAIETISLIATGLIENAKGLSKLAEVLKASNATIECLLKATNE